MNKVFFALLFLLLISCQEKGLDTKYIASNYYKGIVKVLLMNPEVEKIKPGSGYLGRGSGFIVTDDGYIFTNKHVIEMCVKGYVEYEYLKDGKKAIGIDAYSKELIDNPNILNVKYTGYSIPVIQVFNGKEENDYDLYLAEVVATGSGSYDGALLKIVSDIDGKSVKNKFSPIPIGNSDDIHQGENICVYGFPAQYLGPAGLMLKDLSTISVGIMSGYDYVFNNDYGYIKTDAEIHPGNSGGPVFNEENKAIGIATAKGPTTGIGLVGGINGMYYISAIDNKAHTALVENGLTLPKRSTSINATRGDRQPILSAQEINININQRIAKEQALKREKMAEYYDKSEIFFSLIADSPNGVFPDISKRYTNFTLGSGFGSGRGKIRVFLNNQSKSLNTNKLVVLIDKLGTNNKYKKYKDFTVNVSSNYSGTFFDFDFFDVGTYRVSLFNDQQVFINSRTLKMSPYRPKT